MRIARPTPLRHDLGSCFRPVSYRLGHRPDAHAKNADARPGYVIVAVLVAIVVLSLAAYRYTEMMVSEHRAADRIMKNSEAKALADSGMHYAAGILADPNGLSNLGGNPFSNNQYFQGVSIDLGNGRTGYFSLVAPEYSQDQGSGVLPYLFGVMDEGSRININTLVALDPSYNGVAYQVLMLLPGMTDQIASSIIDWIDADDTVTGTDGAEDSYYMALPQPYHCKNNWLDSIEELLLVQGITPYLLFGDDLNRNGQQDPDETASQGTFSYGWAPYLTVYSRQNNVDSTGNPRVNVNSSSLSTTLSSLQTAVGDDLAAYIVAYRLYGPYTASGNAKTTQGSTGQLLQVVTSAVSSSSSSASKNTINSIWSLVGTQVAVSAQGGAKGGTGASGATTAGAGGTTVYACPLTAQSDLLSTALDTLTCSASTVFAGRINVNTASPIVLATLQGAGLSATDIEQIQASQPDSSSIDLTNPTYQTTAWLYTLAQITPAKLQAIEPYITARSQVYRLQSIGYFEKGGPMARIEAVVDSNFGSAGTGVASNPRVVYYRDLTELGPVIDPRTILQQ
jgi:DNA uptake protein ComE-like DNA-binding protein